MGKKRQLRKPKPLSDQLRKIIEDCGVTRYRIAQETGISEQALSKFVTGKQKGLSMDALDELGKYLRLRIVADSDSNEEA